MGDDRLFDIKSRHLLHYNDADSVMVSSGIYVEVEP